MSFRWQLIVTLIVLLIGVSVDGRFRRLSSGLTSFPSGGGWRLIKPNELVTDYSGSSGHLGGQTPLSSIYSSSSGSYLNGQYQLINPVKTISTNQHFQLPIHQPYRLGLYKNHPDSLDSTEFDSELNNQPDNLDQQSRPTGEGHHQQRLLSDSIVTREEHETIEKVTEPAQSISIPSSIGNFNVPRSHLDKIRVNPGSPESLLGEEVSSRSASSVSSSISPSSSSNQIHYANKKAESESAHVGDPLINYRSLNHGNKRPGSSSFSDLYFVAIVIGSSGIAIFAVIGAGYCFYRFQQHNKSAADVDYPAYGVVGPITKENANNSGNISPIGDRKLAQSAQMYHYHHQKQQMIASEKGGGGATSRHTSASDVDSEEENEEGDYTVYECPGLASTGEMEVKNPLFQDDITPVSSPSTVTNGGGQETKDSKK